MATPQKKPEQKETRRAAVGGLILAFIALLAVLVFNLDALRAGGRDQVALYAALDDAVGIDSDSPVWIAGHEVGSVDSVWLLGPGAAGTDRVLVRMSMPRDLLRQVPRGSDVHTTSNGLLGTQVVEIQPARLDQGGTRTVQAGDTLFSRDAPAPLDSARVARVVRHAGRVLHQLDAVDSLVTLRRPQIQAVSARLAVAGGELDRLRNGIAQGPLGRGLPPIGPTLDRVNSNAAVVRQGLGRYANGGLGERLDDVRARLDTLAATMAGMKAAAARPEGFIGRFQRDSALARAMTGARAQLDSLTAEAKSNPFMFVF